MKAQTHIKTTLLKEVDFKGDIITQASKGNPTVMSFDESSGFDTHWEYSYIMDYISLHKIKKRKS